MSNPRVSIIIPAYNEQDIIADTLKKTAAYINKNAKFLGSTEVVVVSAGSDRTSKIAGQHKKLFKNLKLVTPAKRGGKGRDVRLGFRAASGDVQLFMDADLATPLHHIKPMVEALRGEAEVVIGVRRLGKIHPGKIRSLFSIGANIITRITVSPKLKDTQCGFKGFTRSAARQAFQRQRLNGWGFDIELLQLVKEHHLKLEQLRIDDWHEAREEGLRGDSLWSAGYKTLADVALVRLEGFSRFAARNWKFFVASAMVFSFVVAIYLGLYANGGQSVWFDEGYSITLAQGSVGDLLSLTARDAHPPLYYLILKGWSGVFGWSEFAMRSLSALLGALSVGVMAAVLKKLFNKTTAVVSLPFVVLGPFLMRYNFEIRMYSLVMLLGLIATYLLIKGLEDKSTKTWLLYGVVVALGMYTLYMSVMIWFAHAIFLLWRAFKLKEVKLNRRLFKDLLRQKFVWAYGVAIMIFLPYIPTTLSQFQNSALPGILSTVGFSELATILSFGLLYQPEWQLGAMAAAGLLIFLIMIIRLLIKEYSKAKLEQRQRLNLMVLIFLMPILFIAVASLFKPYFIERYTVHFLVFGYSLIGIVIDGAWRRGAHKEAFFFGVLSLGLVFGGILNLSRVGNFNFQSLNRPNAKLIASLVECSSDAVIVAEDPFAYIDSFYYYQDERKADCDLRYYHKDELGKYGGYAPLQYSTDRVDGTSKVNAQTVFHLHWEAEPKLGINTDKRYELVDSRSFDKHFVDEYRLK